MLPSPTSRAAGAVRFSTALEQRSSQTEEPEMSKQLRRPVGANRASNDPSTPVPHHASGSSPISQRESPSASKAREQQIQQIQIAAYHRYEVRRCEPGHDVDDWLAAEAEVGPPSAT
jgi:hypothetical protein